MLRCTKRAPRYQSADCLPDVFCIRLIGGSDAQMQEEQSVSAAVGGGGSTFSWGSIVEGGPLQDNEFERRLAAGANIACRLRGAVREQLGEY